MTIEEFDLCVKDATGKVLAFFDAPWCGPCRVVNPIVDELVEKHNLPLVHINTDDSGPLAGELNVLSIPAFFLYEDGVITQRLVGARSLPDLEHSLGL